MWRRLRMLFDKFFFPSDSFFWSIPLARWYLQSIVSVKRVPVSKNLLVTHRNRNGFPDENTSHCVEGLSWERALVHGLFSMWKRVAIHYSFESMWNVSRRVWNVLFVSWKMRVTQQKKKKKETWSLLLHNTIIFTKFCFFHMVFIFSLPIHFLLCF